MGTATGIIRALNSGIKHIAIKRFTLRYPEEKLKFVGDGYQFDVQQVMPELNTCDQRCKSVKGAYSRVINLLNTTGSA